jgi:hypothetical protein
MLLSLFVPTIDLTLKTAGLVAEVPPSHAGRHRGFRPSGAVRQLLPSQRRQSGRGWGLRWEVERKQLGRRVSHRDPGSSLRAEVTTRERIERSAVQRGNRPLGRASNQPSRPSHIDEPQSRLSGAPHLDGNQDLSEQRLRCDIPMTPISGAVHR